MTSTRVFVLGACAALLSCGGGAPEPVSPGGTEKERGPASQAEEALSPVSAPQDLFAVVRISQPSRVVDTAAQWAGLPVDWRTLLAKELPGADQMLQLDAPIDLAATLDPGSTLEPNAFVAVSIGVTSVEAALSFFQARGDVVKRSERVIRVGDDVTCIAARSLGAAPARLVCGSDEDAVGALLPYMTRGLPTEQLGQADVHARVLAAPFQRRYIAQASLLKTAGVPFVLREASLDHPRFDGALRDVLYGLADELIAVIRDVDRVSLDVTLSGDQSRIGAELSLAFQQAQSFTATALAAQAQRVAPAPESFWSLPGAATSASYSIATDAERFRKASEALAALLDGTLDYLEVGKRVREPVVDSFLRLLTTSSPAMAMASVPTAPVATSSSRASKSKGKAFQDALVQQLGVRLVALDGPVEPFDDFLSAATRLSADRGFRQRLEKLAKLPKGVLPSVKQRGPRGRGAPRGTRVYEMSMSLESLLGEEAKRDRATVLLATVPGDKRSFIALGADEGRLYETIAVASQGGAETLAKRAGLERFRTTKAASAGFSTLLGLLDDMDSPIEMIIEGKPPPTKSVSSLAAILPHRGRTVVPWGIVPSVEGPKVTFAMEVQREVAQDVAAAFAAGLADRLGM